MTQLCTFDVAGVRVGLDVHDVQEVRRPDATVPVPLASPDVVGLANLRGQVIAVVDARTRLGLCAAAPLDDGAHVVVRCGAEPVSLVVDRHCDVVEVDPGDLEPVPPALGAAIGDVAHGVVEIAGALVVVLDARRVLGV